MDWNLFSLKVFSEVARQKNFTKAAKILGLTQPAVSLQVQNLEKQLGCPLLIRKRTGEMALTEGGQVVLRYMENIERVFQNLRRDLEPWSWARNQVAIGCCCIAGEHIVPSYTVAFRRIRPHTRVQCHVGRCANIFGRVLNSSLDVAIAGIPPRDPRLVHVPFAHMPLACFEARGDSLPRRLSIKDLVSEPMVLREEGSGTRVALERFLEQHDLAFDRCTIVATSESNEALKEMVAKGMGWSILPNVVIQKELDQGRLSLIEIKDGCLVEDFFVVYRKHALLNGHQKEFVHLLLQEPRPHHMP